MRLEIWKGVSEAMVWDCVGKTNLGVEMMWRMEI